MPVFVDTGKYLPPYNDSGYIVYFGRLAEGKGLMTLLQAMRKTRGATLCIAGHGPLKTELQRFAEDHNLSNVKFLGFQNDRALKTILAGAAFTVFPSEAYESFGLTIVESFAMGKPVIGSGLGPVPEIINDGVDGLLFEPGNVEALAEKMQYLIDRPELCLDMGHNARRKAEAEYSPSDHYKKLKDLYSSVLFAYGGRVPVPLNSGR